MFDAVGGGKRKRISLSVVDRRATLCCALLFALTTTTATGKAHALRRWSLPPVTKQRNRDFIDRCESLAHVLERLRGGSSSYDPEEWTTPTAPTTGRRKYEEDHDDSYSRRQPKNDRYSSRYEEDYDDYGRGRPPNSSSSSGGGLSAAVPKILKQGDRKIGLLLLASGLSATFLGFALFMNRTLLRLGNLLFIVGVPMTLGPTRTIGYFAKPEKMRATLSLALGIFLVFVGHPLFGIALEVFGLLNLFGNMFPILMVFVKQIPFIGPLLKPSNNRPKSKTSGRGRYDDYYDDYGGGQRQAPPQQNYYDEDYRDDDGSSAPHY